MEYSQPMSLETPRGTLAFNAEDLSDGFYLSEITGMDSALIRSTIVNRPQTDGAWVFDAFHGARYPILSGYIRVSTGDLTDRREFEDELRGCLSSILREDGTLKWTPSGAGSDPEQMRQMTVRISEAPQISGGVLKNFQFSLVSGDPVMYSQQLLSSNTSTLSGAGAGGAFTFPLTFPVTFSTGSSGGTASITNLGNVPTFPVINLYGDATDVLIANITDTDNIKLVYLPGYNIPNGSFVQVNMATEGVYFGGSANSPLLSVTDLADSEFWALDPGNNVVQMAAGSHDSTAYATIGFRHAWA